MRITQTGVTLHDKNRATPGYTVFANVRGPKTYLIDMDGNVVHEWALKSGGGIGLSQLLPGGNLLVLEKSEDASPTAQGAAGYAREYDWDGNLLWEYHDAVMHHDFRRLPNGNSVYLRWEEMDPDKAARVRGGLPGTEYEGGMIYSEVIREIDPDGNTVWEWHLQDQDFEKYAICGVCKRHEFGHANTICPLPNGDYIINYRVFNMFMVIDRQTGKIKSEYGDVEWGHEHDVQMLPNGNFMLYANGYHSPKISISRVIEFNPDTRETVWEYRGNPALTFYSPHISGCQRLASGNTLICEGGPGCIFEVTPEKEIVWEYVCPYTTVSPELGDVNSVFRAYRYDADSPQLKGRF